MGAQLAHAPGMLHANRYKAALPHGVSSAQGLCNGIVLCLLPGPLCGCQHAYTTLQACSRSEGAVAIVDRAPAYSYLTCSWLLAPAAASAVPTGAKLAI